MQVFSAKNLRVTSGTGAAILVTAGVPRDVPIWAVPALLAKGAKLVDETRDLSNVTTKLATKEQIIDALRVMIEDGNPDNFTKRKRPRIPSVQAMLAPLDVAPQDVAEAFDALMNDAGDQ